MMCEKNNAKLNVIPINDDGELDLDEFMGYLAKGLDSLKRFNFHEFQQFYTIFLFIFGAVITALFLFIASNILHSINSLPLIGNLLGGVLELFGLVVVSKFVVSNLLLQKKRADLFMRIAVLKKDLIGQ